MYEITDVDTLNYLRGIFINEHTYEEELILKKAKVILNVNIDVKMGLTNGTIGEIKEIEENIIHFEYEFKVQKLVAFITSTEKDDTVPYLYVTRWKFPISLAYCLTMHKFQGKIIRRSSNKLRQNSSTRTILFYFSKMKEFEKNPY